jgi:hypothetical protein
MFICTSIYRNTFFLSPSLNNYNYFSLLVITELTVDNQYVLNIMIMSTKSIIDLLFMLYNMNKCLGPPPWNRRMGARLLSCGKSYV